MSGCRLWGLLLALLFWPPAWAAEMPGLPAQIRLVSEEWIDYTNADGSGLAWVRRYKYQDYLPNVRHFNEILRRDGILSMLQHSRADYYIDALAEVDYVLGQAPDPSVFRRTHLVELPLYLGFSDSERGRALLALYDRRMDELVKGGRLRSLFERWKQPYPFESDNVPAATDQTY
ncbi:hypothetical protein [Pseudomonas gingeri]|uniref:hypothetical protein n=1 Tax=Pseudomonas gingeri TaxID=117681 RepID=UPI0015A444A0|nr:hypothetical protein [Pseudomonas gingeri]NWA02895.1 hypothetical protein [Pseudomonas gingeri]NWA17058.1 hypothetical protein [Pseudomonas gingeri]NWA58509.1 hypothetical protein [Pseudomonas gingeri]NWA97903.1 hypothetical protein [Pseudomonas gingeri]NWB06013.1 hypothetical protein [Pseudomonas gingeri]